MKPRSQSLNILVAEDDEADFQFLKIMFRETTTALLFRVTDGEETIDYLKGAGPFCDRSVYPLPDILLLDLLLPKVSGHEVLEWLRGRAQLRALRVYVLAGSDRESDRHRAREAGADDYFIKPLSLGHLAVLFDPPARKKM
jgi:DNA-binding response OmpR family regulator